MRRFLAILAAATCLLAVSGCFPRPAGGEWGRTDLRWLGAASAPTPATDLIAVYTHVSRLTLDIRIDLLDINPGDVYRFHLSLWDNRSFSLEPFQVDLAADGTVRTTNARQGTPVIWPRVTQDFDLDTINISLNRFLLGDHFRLEAATFLPGSSTPTDLAENIRSDGLPPTRTAPLLLAFTDVFPVETPVQALRRWDGAHTGPLGGRDGLRYVVEAVKRYQLPVALLDLKRPASLAALNYLDVLGGIRSLERKGLLLLPEAAYSEPADMALALSRESAAGFGLAGSRFVYSAAGVQPSGYSARFASLPDRSHLSISGGTRWIPLPAGNAQEATEAGPSLEVRRALVTAMLSPDPVDLVVLGGSLPNTTWGSADQAGATFLWLAGHPWVWALNAADQLAFPVAAQAGPAQAVSGSAPSPLEQELRSAPNNAVTRLAWHTYLHLQEPSAEPRLTALRQAYFGEVSDLLAAARWAESPSARAECSPGEAGAKDCILANQVFYAAFASGGARLKNLFYRDGRGVHQLVGPSGQFAAGLSDPSEWDLAKGEAADPNAIQGAFVDARAPWVNYTAAITAGALTFTSPDGKLIKTFRLAQAGLEAEYQAAGSETVRIPLALDPQAFYFGPSTYQPTLAPHAWTWKLVGGLAVVVRTDARLSAQGFVSSFPFLSMSEDPNLDYPSGHFLPFPLSLAVIQGEGDFKVTIGLK